jgi:hypothetical protein
MMCFFLLSVFAVWGLLAMTAFIDYRLAMRAHGWLCDLAWCDRGQLDPLADPV